MGRTTVYLDAGYIDKVLHYDHANARLDFAKSECSPSRELFEVCDERKQLTADVVARIRR